MRRISIALTDGECSALLSLAERERRDPRAQAAVLIRDELERWGLLREGTARSRNTQRSRPVLRPNEEESYAAKGKTPGVKPDVSTK